MKYNYDVTHLLMLNMAGSLVVGTLWPNEVNKILMGPSNDEIIVEMINDEEVNQWFVHFVHFFGLDSSSTSVSII